MNNMFKRIDFKLDGDKITPGFFVTSPQIPGLLANGPTIPEALEEAAKAIRDLALASAMEIASGNYVRPMFKDTSVAQTVEAQT